MIEKFGVKPDRIFDIPRKISGVINEPPRRTRHRKTWKLNFHYWSVCCLNFVFVFLGALASWRWM